MSVILRPIREDDLPLLTEWLNDPEVTATTIREFSNLTLEDERAWFARKTAPDCPDHPWTIELEGRPIGTCELHIEELGQTAFYGIIIGDKTAWNQGHGTAATREAVRVGFEELGYQRIWLQVGSHNPRGMRCYEKVGFRREGVLRRARLKRGKWVDVVLMAILKEEWEVREGDPQSKPADGVTIRGYRASDHPAVTALLEATGFHLGHNDEAKRIAWKLATQTGFFFVAECDGKLVGTVVGSLERGWGWVQRLAVHPDYRRRGIARRPPSAPIASACSPTATTPRRRHSIRAWATRPGTA